MKLKRSYKKYILLIMLLLLSAFIRCSKTKEINNTINVEEVQNVTITAQLSSPKVKIINNKEDIEKIITFINSINLENIKQEDINGWKFLIQTKGEKFHSISLGENKIHIDNIWYQIDSNELKKFRNIYNELDYKEIPFSEYRAQKGN